MKYSQMMMLMLISMMKILIILAFIQKKHVLIKSLTPLKTTDTLAQALVKTCEFYGQTQKIITFLVHADVAEQGYNNKNNNKKNNNHKHINSSGDGRL